MAYSNSRNEYLFFQKQTVQGTFPNSSGSSTIAGANAMRISRASMNFANNIIQRPVKNGSLSRTVGIAGKRNSSWSVSTDLHGSGVAGTKPDMDELLEAAFGQAGTVSAGVSVTYALEDLSPYIAIFDFRDPSTVDQRAALGCIVASARFALGSDIATAEFSGESTAVLISNQFASADTTSKGGLTAFPSKPTPVYNGTAAVGFTGQITLDGNVYTTIRSATINMSFARELQKDIWNSYYPGPCAQDVRDVTVDFAVYDDDTANLTALKGKAIAGTTVNLIFQVGTVAGNIWTFNLNNVLLGKPEYDDGSRLWGINFNGCQANASAGGAKDECTLVLT